MEIVRRIYELLIQCQGLKVREIARKLELDAFEVSDVLFSSDCIPYWYQNDSSCWFAKEGAIEVVGAVEQDPIIEQIYTHHNFDKTLYVDDQSHNSLCIYLDEISKYRVYNDDEVAELLVKYRSGDTSAYDLLVKSHLRMVVNLARLYKSKGVAMVDLIQEGNLGLLKSIEKYDVSKNTSFSKYAQGWILQAISSAVQRLSHIVWLPFNQISEYRKVRKFADSFEQENLRSPALSEIDLNLEYNSLSYLYSLPNDLSEITQYLDDWESFEDIQLIATDHNLMIESDNIYVQQMLKLLTIREYDVLKSYFGIQNQFEESIDSISKRHKLTRERVRQLIENSIKKIKEVVTKN